MPKSKAADSSMGEAKALHRKQRENVTLTDTRVSRLKGTGRLCRVWDDKVPGFHVQITPAGSKSFRVQFQRKDGAKVSITIGSFDVWTVEDAREKAAALRKDHDEGVDVRAKRFEELNAADLKTLIEKWRSAPTGKLKLKPTTQASYESILKHNLLPALGNRLVKDISRKDVREFHTKTSEKHKITANRAVAVLGNLLKFAMELGWRDEGAPSPCHAPPKNNEKAKDRVFSPAELARLESALQSMTQSGRLDPPAADLFRFLALSGLRKGEALGLKFADLDLEAHTMRFEDHKTASRAGMKKLPLNSHLEAIVRRRAAERISAYVFPGRLENSPIVGVAKMWERILIEAKFVESKMVRGKLMKMGPGEVTPHDLRRTFYSTVQKLAFSFDIADILTGHALPRIRATYGIDPHESPAVIQASQDSADWIAAAMAGKGVKPGVKWKSRLHAQSV